MRHTGELPKGTFGYGHACEAMLMSGERDFRPVTRACWDVSSRLADLDAAGVDMQLISATPILFQWSRPAEVAVDVARHFNNAALEMCEGSGGRLRAICQVPLQDVDAACRELERATTCGHVGVHIGNHVGTKDLDDAGLITFLQRCAELDAPVLVHPWDMDPLNGRLDHYMMGWTVGMPLETHLSITSMILGGAFDALPRSLRLCFAHGGGAFAFLLGRLENAWHERSLARGKSLHPPSHYLDRFSVDSAVFDDRALRLLVDTLGAERVMLGSDYPFPLGEQRIGELVRTCPTLSASERDAILGGNAATFFGVAAEGVSRRAAAEAAAVEAAAAAEGRARFLRKRHRAMARAPPHSPTHSPLDGSVLRPEEIARWTPGQAVPPAPLSPPAPPSPLPPRPNHLAYGSVPAFGLRSAAPLPGMGAASVARALGTHASAHPFRHRHRRRSYATATAPSSASSPARAYSAAVLSTGHRADATWFDDALLSAAEGAGAKAAEAPSSSAAGWVNVCNHVAGAPTDASGGAVLPLIDAVTGRPRGSVPASAAADVDAAVSAAARALRDGPWASASAAERAAVLHRAAALVEAEADAFAAAESADTGKPLRLARLVDVPRAVANLRFFAGLVEHASPGPARHGGGMDRGGGADDALNYVVRKPVGVVGLVTPWNLPLYLLSWKLAPALAMGNTVVAKPSELTPTTASMLSELLTRAGLPPGVFNVVHGTGADAGAALCAHPEVAALSFTGGTATGAAVAAAVAPRFAKLSLELGGQNALVVFADCDFDATVDGAVRASFLNSGQICLCASRVLVERTADGFYERFATAFAERTRALRVGHPLDETTDLGPLISAAQLERVSAHVGSALERGAGGVVALSGGPGDARAADAARAHGHGHWCAPTVLDGCAPGDAIAQEEVFGPVVTLHPFESAAEAVELANGTRYGLAASVWTSDLRRAHSIAHALDAGTVWVNAWLHRQLHMPFGGLKASGVAREGGEASLDFYSEASTVCVKLGDTRPPPMPGLRGGGGGGGAILGRGPRRGLHTTAATAAAAPSGYVGSAPRPMGAYAHARRVGDLLFLAGLGPRDAATDTVPGGPIEAADGSRADYDAAAQTRACISNVREVLRAHGLGLDAVVDVQCFLVDMKRDFAAFNAEYAAAFGALDAPPTRTTMEVAELPPGGRIAVELKVIATCAAAAGATPGAPRPS